MSTEPVGGQRNDVAAISHNGPVHDPRYASPKSGMTASLPPTHQGVASLSAALIRTEQPANATYAAASPVAAPATVPAAKGGYPNDYSAAPRNDGLVEVGPTSGAMNGPGSWYNRNAAANPAADEMRSAALPVATTAPPVNAPGIPWQQPGVRTVPNAISASPPSSAPIDRSMSRPPTPEQPRQIILEWTRQPGGQPQRR